MHSCSLYPLPSLSNKPHTYTHTHIHTHTYTHIHLHTHTHTLTHTRTHTHLHTHVHTHVHTHTHTHTYTHTNVFMSKKFSRWLNNIKVGFKSVGGWDHPRWENEIKIEEDNNTDVLQSQRYIINRVSYRPLDIIRGLRTKFSLCFCQNLFALWWKNCA